MNHKLNSKNIFHILSPLTILLFICFIYKDGLRYNIFFVDDNSLISPLLDQHLFNFSTDLLPLRDLTYKADLFLGNIFKTITFKYTNIVLYFFCILFAHLIIGSLTKNSKYYLAPFVLASHPIFINTNLWVSGRKYILATLFILIAWYFLTLFLEKAKRVHLIFSTIFIMLSLLSHSLAVPATVITFCFFKYFKKNIKNKDVTCFFAFNLSLVVFYSIINYFYYKNKFTIGEGLLASPLSTIEMIRLKFLSIGRSFFNITLPFECFFWYSDESIYNLLGLTLLVSLIFFFIKKRKFKETYLLILSLFPIIFTSLFISFFYPMDGYSYLTIFIIYIIAMSKYKFSPRMEFIFLITAIVFSTISFHKAALWKSQESLLKHNIASENNIWAMNTFLIYESTQFGAEKTYKHYIKYLKKNIHDELLASNNLKTFYLLLYQKMEPCKIYHLIKEDYTLPFPIAKLFILETAMKCRLDHNAIESIYKSISAEDLQELNNSDLKLYNNLKKALGH